MRVLVTGGAGFVGSHVVDGLVAHGHEVIVLDSLSPAAHAERPGYLRPEVTYLWADLADPDAVATAVRGVEAVSHQAARVGLGVDFGDVTGYVADNDLGTAVLLGALHRDGFKGPVVLASSMVVYGESVGRCPNHGLTRPRPRPPAALDRGSFEPPCPECAAPLEPMAVTEDMAPDPRNVYAATKLHQEHLCSLFGREQGAPVTVLRYHNVYGARMPADTPYAGVASIFRSALARGEPPLVFEDGGQRRDFVHVTDVAAANLSALDAAAAGTTGTYNVASGTPVTIGEVATILARAADGPEPRVTGRWRAGDVRHITASAARAASELGFRARVRPADGLARFVAEQSRQPVAGHDGRSRRHG